MPAPVLLRTPLGRYLLATAAQWRAAGGDPRLRAGRVLAPRAARRVLRELGHEAPEVLRGAAEVHLEDMRRAPVGELLRALLPLLGDGPGEPGVPAPGARLCLVRFEPPPVQVDASREAPARAPLEVTRSTEPTRSFVELRVYDELGLALKDASFELCFDSGETVSGSLDGDGYADQPDTPAGSFYAVFSDYDPEAYDSFGDQARTPTGTTVRASVIEMQGEGVPGRAGGLSQLVVHHPKQRNWRIEGGGFAFGSSFPGRSVIGALPAMLEQADAHPEAKLRCFGHTDAEGSEEANKKESDLRATALHALLTGDQDAFDDLAEKDAWSLIHYQEMLCALGYEMPIDGEDGPKTEAGTRRFQRAYNRGAFGEQDADGNRQPPEQKLGVDGKPGPKTQAALRESYLRTFGAALPADRFADPPRAGCSEFNLLGGEPDADRRVSLALLDPEAKPQQAPCAEGDAGACPVYEGDDFEGKRCKHYGRWFGHERVLGVGALPAIIEGPHIVLWNAHALESMDKLKVDWSGGTGTAQVVDSDECTVVLEASGAPSGQLLALRSESTGGGGDASGSSGTAMA